MLADYASTVVRDCEETIEDHFTIEAVEPGRLRLVPMLARKQVWVPVPRQISNACVVSWEIAGAIGKTAKGWRLLDVWNIYP
jgi:hypothetical protein